MQHVSVFSIVALLFEWEEIKTCLSIYELVDMGSQGHALI